MSGARRSRTRILGVVGHPVGHSLSPRLHGAAFRHLAMDAAYLAFDVPPGALELALRGAARLGVWGLNVTAPHKEEAYRLASRWTPRAQAAGSVNVLRWDPEEDGWTGDSTDGEAVLAELATLDPPPTPGRALVLGAGGVARAVVASLRQAGWTVKVCARRWEAAQALAQSMDPTGDHVRPWPWEERHQGVRAADLTVQATPLGGFTRPGADPLRGVPPQGVLVELAYGQGPTPLERRWREAGLPAVGGLSILCRQAALSWDLWFGLTGPLAVMRRAVGLEESPNPRPPLIPQGSPRRREA
jgi:shikimate dehydrogenase